MSHSESGKGCFKASVKKIFTFLIALLRRITSGKGWGAKFWDRSGVNMRQARERCDGLLFRGSSGAL